ncbi:MAG: ribosomal RNA small subunit methyltransferase I, partial [Gemmatimonadales bacterium]
MATPIGNLGDLSERATAVLTGVAVVAAEDTRRTRPLLAKIGSTAKLESLHAHTDARKIDRLLDVIGSGRAIALVSDAGTPAVSDPGTRLIAGAHRRGYRVVPVPGPSAVTAAVSASGFGADRFTFLGFLPRKGKQRRETLALIRLAIWPTVLF